MNLNNIVHLTLGHANALGSGQIDVAANGTTITSTTPVTTGNDFTFSATGAGATNTITLAGSGAMTFTGDMSMDAGANVQTRGFNVTSSEVMTWSGNISQTSATLARNIVKQGTGTMVLGGANTYLGTTTVEQGTLLVNNTTGSGTGANDVTVNADAILGGTGTISPGTGKAVTVNGSLAPGNAGVGTLTVNGAVTLAPDAGYAWQYLNGNGDLVDVNGTLTLPAAATVNVSGDGALPATMTLFTANSLDEAGATDLSGWTVNGLKDGKAAIQGTSVILKTTPSGTVISIR